MATLDERVAYIEGQMAEQSHAFVAVRDSLTGLERRVDRLEQRVDARFDAMERRFDGVERHINGLDDKMSRQFLWMVGIQITTLVAIVGALVSRG